MAGRETQNHRGLKTLALAWAAERGMSLGAPEVSFPHRRFRVDAAACLFQREVPARPPSATLASVLKVAVVFECKQVRSDLIRDTKQRKTLTRHLEALEQRRKELETLLKIHHPHFANGESLFREFDSYRLGECDHKGYPKLLRDIAIAKRGLIKGTKFDRLLSYRMANLHYLVVEDKLIKSHEIPTGWGLLVRRDETLVLVEQPVWQEIATEEQLVFLQRIASKGGRLRRPMQEDSSDPLSILPTLTATGLAKC
jgi:hypothetical protein